MIEELIAQLYWNTQKTLAAARRIEEPTPLYRIERGWNGIQILEHLLLTDRLIGQVIFSPPEGLAEQPFLVGDQNMRQLLIEDRSPMESPLAVRPSGTLTRPYFMVEYAKMRGNLVTKLRTPTALDINRFYSNPFLGNMTYCDWLLFIIYHTDRHIRQIENLEKQRYGNKD